MLMSYPELRRDPGPMTTSTPNKQRVTNDNTTHSLITNGNGYPNALINGQTENSHSCPASPVGSSVKLSPTPVSEPEVSSASSFAMDGRDLTMAAASDTNQHAKTPVAMSINSAQPNMSGYKSVKRKLPQETNSLKQRLLLALADMIPHKESLTLRLLVNYTIDDQNSECLVIDETLCRQSAPREKQAKLDETSHSDSGCVADEEEYEQKPLQRNRPFGEAHILDLSVHSDRDELELEEAMNTEPEEIAEDDQLDSRTISPTAVVSVLPGSRTTNTETIDTSSLLKNITIGSTASLNPLLMPNLTSGQTNIPTIFTTSSLPLVDSSVLALLPLLQQQQQQQQQTPHRLLGQTRIVPHSELHLPNTVPTALPTETAETLLFKEFQALLQGNSNNNPLAYTTAAPTYTTTINGIGPHKMSVTKPMEAVTCVSNAPTANLLNTSQPTPVSSTPSLVSFPLFNAFTPEQLTALLPPGPFLNNSMSTAPNMTSLNLGSATLFNLKDKHSLETVNIMPATTNKQLPQPVASLLNHITVPQATPISLRTLSTLSQLFNSNVDQMALKNKVLNSTGLLSNSNEAKFSVSLPTTTTGERKHQDAMATSLSGTTVRSSNPTMSTPPREFGITQSQADGLGPASEHDFADNGSVNMNNTSITNGSFNNNSNQFMFGRRLAHTRRFICNQCRKNFASLAELNRHTLEAHTSFKCTICSAHFTQRSNLQRHSLKHVGFKPFTCNLCNKEYYRKDHLVRHIEVTHPNHDPKMNITVHLTSSECLDYLDRIQAGKGSPSTENPESHETAPGTNDDPDVEEVKSEGLVLESLEDNLDNTGAQSEQT